MPRTSSRVNKGVQIKARAAAKRSRVEEGGLRGPRLGKISARTRKAQARRDAKADAVNTPAETARGKSAPPAAPAAPMSKAAAKKSAAAAKPRRRRASPLVEVRTASSVDGSARLDAFAEKIVTAAISRFMPRLTRIDVHLSDANAQRQGGDDKRCQIEARPASQQPVSATATAGTIEQALARAAGKMKRLLGKRLDPRVRA